MAAGAQILRELGVGDAKVGAKPLDPQFVAYVPQRDVPDAAPAASTAPAVAPQFVGDIVGSPSVVTPATVQSTGAIASMLNADPQSLRPVSSVHDVSLIGAPMGGGAVEFAKRKRETAEAGQEAEADADPVFTDEPVDTTKEQGVCCPAIKLSCTML